jgi:hypothetical protein
VLAVLTVGCLWGSAIGFALGGMVGAFYFLIGALYGAPIGAIVGLVIGLPASVVVVAVLLVADRPVTDIERLASHVAGSLATFIVALTAAGLAAIANFVVARGQWSGLRDGVLAAGAVLLGFAAAAWLLRFAARDLTRTWARAWGWKVVR